MAKEIIKNVSTRLVPINPDGFSLYKEINPGKIEIWGSLITPLNGDIQKSEEVCTQEFFLGDKTSDQGLLLTDVDISQIFHGLSVEVLPQWLIEKAQVQRASYLSHVNSPERICYLRDLNMRATEIGKNIPLAFAPMEEATLRHRDTKHGKKITKKQLSSVTNKVIHDYKDFGYITQYTPRTVSRDAYRNNNDLSSSPYERTDLYGRVGKHVRSLICLAPMPDVSASIDAITTAAMSHMLAVIPRNFHFTDIDRQAAFAHEVLQTLESHPRPEHMNDDLWRETKDMWKHNVCGAIGVGKDTQERFEKLYDAGVRSFRLYSIATDIHIENTVKDLLSWMDTKCDKDEIELFIGQITSVDQLDHLYNALTPDQWKRIDGVYLGNGGGRQCKTAETGMIVNTPYLSYELRRKSYMRDVSIVVEGGIGNEPATALLFGASAISYAKKLHGIESPGGALTIRDAKGEWFKPYRGEASVSAKKIERILYESGDTKQVEGANGVARIERKHPSICGRIVKIEEWLSQSFAKLGIQNIDQLHALGVPLRRKQFEKIFGFPPENIPGAYTIKHHGKRTYIIPFPLRLRTEAQQIIASSYGDKEKRVAN